MSHVSDLIATDIGKYLQSRATAASESKSDSKTESKGESKGESKESSSGGSGGVNPVVQCLPHADTATCCYIVSCPKTKDAVVIDCVLDYDQAR